MKIYHYTTVDKFCKIWVSKRILFADSQRTNDLYEQRKGLPSFNKLLSNKEYNSIIEAAKDFDKLFTQELSLYKQISFVMDYLDDNDNIIYEGWQSSMMWGQYAHNEVGVCIELDVDKLHVDSSIYSGRISYKDEIPSLPQEDNFSCDTETIKDYIKQNISTIFFVKHKHWEHENEYRMIKRGEDGMFLSIEDAISNIYVYSVDDIDAEIVNNLISKKINLYALWIEEREGSRIIDKIDYRHYHDIMDGKMKPGRPTFKK